MPAPLNLVVRVMADGIAAILLATAPATYRVPFGPTTSAAGSVRSLKPPAITLFEVTVKLPPLVCTPMRTTVPRCTIFPAAATVPLRTLVTNRVNLFPLPTAVMSHGPLISPPLSVLTTLPLELRTVSAPAVMLADMPPGAGRLPTTTTPFGSSTSAVVRPTALALVGRGTTANTCALPLGETSMMLDPVPCWFLELLKFETSTSPFTSLPTER